MECRLLYVLLQGALAQLCRRIAMLQRRSVPLYHIVLAREPAVQLALETGKALRTAEAIFTARVLCEGARPLELPQTNALISRSLLRPFHLA